jgi:hypothetical protein
VASEPRDAGLHQRLGRVGCGDICPDRAVRRAKRAGARLGGGAVDIGEHLAITFGGKALSGGPTDPGTAAGDEDRSAHKKLVLMPPSTDST